MTNKSIFATCLLAICVGCAGTNMYYEHDAIGLDLTVPICGQRVGLVLGSVKSTSTAVRGGTSFDSQSTSGTGLNGNATVARKTTFRANAQLNEGNVVKIMESPYTSDKAKVVLAKQIGDGVVAPDFEPTAMRTRDGVIYANGYKGSAIPNDFSSTGIDKIIEDTTGVITSISDDITSSATTVIGGTTGSITTITKNLYLAKMWAGISTIALCALAFFLFGKKKTKKKKEATTEESENKQEDPPEFPQMAPDPSADVGEGADPDVIIAPDIDDPDEFKKPEGFDDAKVHHGFWWHLLHGFIFLFSFWFGLDADTRADIIGKIKKKK